MKKLILVFLLLASPLEAVTRYVDGTISPASCTTYTIATRACGAGSLTAYKTIVSAISAGTTVAGDTLYIRAGNYVEIIQDPASGTSFANAVTIAGYPSESPVVRAFGMNSGQYVIVSNIVFDAANILDQSIYIRNANHVRVQNCEVKNGTFAGIHTVPEGSATSHEFINLTVHDNGNTARYDHGIYLTTVGDLIENSNFYNNAGFGVQLQASGSTIIRNNLIHNNCSVGEGGGIVILNTTGTTLAYNNFVYANNGASCYGGIQANGNSNVRIYNNTIADNATSDSGIVYWNNAAGAISNNIIYNNSNVSVAMHSYGGNGAGFTLSSNLCNTAATGCSAGNPGFVGGTNYHLAAGTSPAVNTATFTPTEFNTDYDGNSRPQGSAWDIGADEFVSGGTPTISILNPAAGASWTIGSPQTITWTSSGTVGSNVIIEMDRDNNTSYETSIVASTPTANGSYTWSVTGPATVGDTAKVRVKDTGAATNSISGLFSIAASAGGTLTKRITDNGGTGYIPGVDDNFMWSQGTADNYGILSNLYIGKTAVGDHNHGLIRFSGLSQIPSTATVTTVTLGIYVEDTGAGATESIELRRLLRAWTEQGSTWTSYSTGSNWQTAGGLGALDRVSTVLATIPSIAQTAGYYTVTDTGNLKTFVQNIVSGSAANEGLHLEDPSQDGGYRAYTSSDGLDGHRPYLDVTYTVGTSTITMTEPKAGDLFLSGQDGPVRWTSQGISGSVTIDLSRDGGTTWENLKTAGFADADVSVTYNAPTSSNCKVRVVSVNDTAILGTSSTFRIGGTRSGFLLVP